MFINEDMRLAYIAGFFDGDGYIGLSSDRKLLHIVATNGVKAPIQLIADTFGGNILERYPPKGRRIEYRWQRKGFPAGEALEKFAPYLVAKKEQALLGLKSVGASDIKRFEIYKQLQILKR